MSFLQSLNKTVREFKIRSQSWPNKIFGDHFGVWVIFCYLYIFLGFYADDETHAEDSTPPNLVLGAKASKIQASGYLPWKEAIWSDNLC